MKLIENRINIDYNILTLMMLLDDNLTFKVKLYNGNTNVARNCNAHINHVTNDIVIDEITYDMFYNSSKKELSKLIIYTKNRFCEMKIGVFEFSTEKMIEGKSINIIISLDDQQMKDNLKRHKKRNSVKAIVSNGILLFG